MAEAGPGRARGTGEAGSLLDSARRLRRRVPELALLLADRAAASAWSAQDRGSWLGAEQLVVSAMNRLGRSVEVTQRVIAALRAGEAEGALADCAALRVELARCAAEAGEHAVAVALLVAALDAGYHVPVEVRTAALAHAAEQLCRSGRADEAAAALAEADEQLGADPDLGADDAVLARAELRLAAAAGHRRAGRLQAAETEATDGLGLLADLVDPDVDGGHLRASLTLELVLILLERDAGDAALRVARPVLSQPARAATAASTGWLALALATRVHLPAGDAEQALSLLTDAATAAQRHSLDAVLASCLQGLAQLRESRGELAEALRCLRGAHAAERRHRWAAEVVRRLLADEIPHARTEADDLCDRLAELARAGEHRHRFAEVDEATGLLNSGGFRRRLAAALGDGRPDQPVSLVLVDTTRIGVARGSGDAAGWGLREMADRLRDAAPERAALGRVDEGVLGALLPGSTRAEALGWAEQLRAALPATGRGGPPPINVGIAQHRAGSSIDQLISDADRALATAGRPGRHRVLGGPVRWGGLKDAAEDAGGADEEPQTSRPLTATELLARLGPGATGRHSAPDADQPEPEPDVEDRASLDEPVRGAPPWQSGGGTGIDLDPVDPADLEVVADDVLPPPDLPTTGSPSPDGPGAGPASSGPATDPGGAEDPWDGGSGHPKAAPRPGTEPPTLPSGPAAASLPHPSAGILDVPAANGSAAAADDAGLAELLAEALAAYQQGRDEESAAELDPSAHLAFFEAPTVPEINRSELRSPRYRPQGGSAGRPAAGH